MAKFKKYGYPLFMGASGLLTTVSDLIQKNEIAVTLSIFLAIVGIITIATPLNVQQRVLRVVSDGVDDGFSPRAFGSTCILLAAAVFGFSTLSAKAAPEGGIIASQYPEIQQIQVKLGVIEQATARIEDKTDQLLTATRQWVSIIDLHAWTGKPESIILGIENKTPFFFKNINGSIKTSNNDTFEFKDIALGADEFNFVHFDHEEITPVGLIVCITGERENDKVFIKEVRHYNQGRVNETKAYYTLNRVDGPTITNEKDKCDI